MSGVFFASDLHLGHRSVLKHTKETGGIRGGTTVEEHDEWIIQRCLSVAPNKRTIWWFLGDIAMDEQRLTLLDRVPGKKRLILGNHDKMLTHKYLLHVDYIRGTVKHYGFWISHIPVPQQELRGLCNVHGHTHHNDFAPGDLRYLNTAFEWLPNQQPIELTQVREYFGL